LETGRYGQEFYRVQVADSSIIKALQANLVSRPAGAERDRLVAVDCREEKSGDRLFRKGECINVLFLKMQNLWPTLFGADRPNIALAECAKDLHARLKARRRPR
jgi:hypothetical protein